MPPRATKPANAVPVLYVDDERSNRLVFEHGFGADFDITTVASAAEALVVLQNERVGVVVTDQRMPGMSGNELLAEVKERWPDTVRVVITAHSDVAPMLKAINAGLVARYIVKPWERDELKALLQWACEVYRLGQHDHAVRQRLVQTERLAMIGSITAGAMHDLNAPLQALLGNAEVLARYALATPALDMLFGSYGHTLETRDRQRVREVVGELPSIAADILETAVLSARVVRQIGRVLRGTASDEETSVAPLGILHHALSIGKSQLPAGAVARYRGPSIVPVVQMIPSDLFRVMVNLVLNAAQALQRKPGGPHTVELDARYDRDRVDLIVRDNGPGMSKAVLQRAQKEFFTTRSDGTGLGLSQCTALVERAGGTMIIDSTEGEGTTVTVSLIRHEILTQPPAALDTG